MTEHPKFRINRHVIVLIPKRPFLDWLLASFLSPAINMTIEDLRDENEAFLIPDDVANTTDDAVKWVEKNWRMFFEHILFGYVRDETLWPKISLKMFREWFDVKYQSIVWDLGKCPIASEDWEEVEEEPTVH